MLSLQYVLIEPGTKLISLLFKAGVAFLHSSLGELLLPP
jgi:hypothetical protein